MLYRRILGIKDWDAGGQVRMCIPSEMKITSIAGQPKEGVSSLLLANERLGY
jgi:hypothetical protein